MLKVRLHSQHDLILLVRTRELETHVKTLEKIVIPFALSFDDESGAEGVALSLFDDLDDAGGMTSSSSSDKMTTQSLSLSSATAALFTSSGSVILVSRVYF